MFPESSSVVRVLDGLEAREFWSCVFELNFFVVHGALDGAEFETGGFADTSPDDDSDEYFVEGLEEDESTLEIFEEVVCRWFDAKGVEPKCEHTCLALAFCVAVFAGT